MMIKILITLFISLAMNMIKASDCPEGQTFNSNLNRCIMTQQSVQNREDFTQCDDAADKEACVKAAANERVEDTKDSLHKHISANDVDGNRDKAKITNTITAAYSGLSAWFAWGAENKTPATMSAKIFMATSAAFFLKTTFFEKDVKKKVKKMTETFEQEVSSDIGMKDAQLKAFDYLEAQQQLIQKQAKKQKNFYNMTSLGYLGAMGTAAYEAFFNSTGCSASGLAMVNCPIPLIGISALAAANSRKLANAAGDQAKQAGENVEKIQDLKKKFIASIADYCPDGREDMSNPSCFCYLSDGEKNPNRTNSQICQAEWNKYQNLYVETKDDPSNFNIEDTSGCMYVDGKFDQQCNCKKVKNSKGQNACMKVQLPKQSVSALGGINTSPAIGDINKTLEGYSDVGVLNPGIEKLSAVANSKRDKILNAVTKKLGKKGPKNPRDLANKITKAVVKSHGGKLPNILKTNSALAGNATRGKGLSPNVQKALANLNASAGLSAASGGSRKKGLNAVKDKNDWLDFGDEASAAGGQILEFADNSHMNKKYKYDDSIIEDKGASIWKVISNRYNTSGLRRLFADE
ncbi:MAG: hypothetical protein VX341_09680 [Bdellovibrionota bacterium]|nr:hypothetical protein [Bdellovibrionota bacterium]